MGAQRTLSHPRGVTIALPGRYHGQNILKRDFSTSFALKLMLNNAGPIEEFGGSLESPIPALRVVRKNLEPAVTLGFGKENASAVIKALEKEARVEVKAHGAD